MENYTFDEINRYSKYISNTEDSLCYRTLNKIKNIFENNGFKISNHKYEDSHGLKYSYQLQDQQGNDFLFLVQGSFANGTCIRQESDLDIAIISETIFRGIYRTGVSGANYGFSSSSFNILEFKKKIYHMLQVNGFNAKIGNKCINVDYAETNKKSFDIVPCLRLRDYSRDFYYDHNNYQPGTLIETEDGNERVNFPEQSIEKNTKKNNETNYYYKKVVRILKNIKKDMEDDNILVAKKVSSFELECLIHNVPNFVFKKTNYLQNDQVLADISMNVVEYLFNHRNDINNWLETNEILLIYNDSNKDVTNTKSFLEKLYEYFQ